MDIVHGGDVYYLAEGQGVQADIISLISTSGADDGRLEEYRQAREALVAEYNAVCTRVYSDVADS
jgi:hypothetical protein